ncbi:MAG: GNAT family N-acetyltransferase [Anaerolineaceae bacterium]|nr:GNAT family N-acetyltransferase [Anaerolineaceae bacterium]
MTDVCDFLSWDTTFFGMRLGRVRGQFLDTDRCQMVDQWAAANEIAGLYFLANADDAQVIRTAEANHFHLTDVRMTFDYRIPAQPVERPVSHLLMRPSTPDDVQPLIDISKDAYVHSRFYHDPHFSPEQCSALYQTWIRRSCLEDYADEVWVAEIGGQPIGYVTCHLDQEAKDGSIGLVGIAEQARGQKVGEQLVNRALNWFAEQRMATVSVVTQGSNIGAQRLYQKCGFATRFVQLWYHKWYIE